MRQNNVNEEARKGGGKGGAKEKKRKGREKVRYVFGQKQP